MRILAQTPNLPKRKFSAGRVRSDAPKPGPDAHPDPRLHLQRTMGNQAVLRMQAEGAQAGAPGNVPAPSIVEDVVGSSGHPLDLPTRAFAEQRFGRDFDDVRVHTDAKAAASARAIDARAYTVASDIVFGAGQYDPHTTGGRTLLAHELTHVVQPQASEVIRRQPDAQESSAEERDAWLRGLSEQPAAAHREWQRLSGMERMAVVVQMTNRYGYEFARSFLSYTEQPIKPVSHHFGPGFPEHTPDWFQARGYQLWQRSSVNEFWVHPSGSMMMQILDQPRGAPTASPPPVPAEEDSTALADVTSSILRDEIAVETAVKEDLEGWKGRLERMNKTTDEYRDQYEQYMQSLRAMQGRLVTALNDIEVMRQQLVEMNSLAVTTIDLELQELLDLQIWADIESSPMSTQFLQPFNLQPKDVPDDEE